MNIRSSALLSLFLLTSCQMGGQVSSSSFLPEIKIECRPSDSSSCLSTSVSKYMILGLSTNSGFDCATQMSSFNTSQFRYYFDAYNQASLNWDGAKVNAHIYKWFDQDQFQLFTLDQDNYVLCVLFDINGNEKLDSGEPYAQSSGSLGQDYILIDTWTEY